LRPIEKIGWVAAWRQRPAAVLLQPALLSRAIVASYLTQEQTPQTSPMLGH
jgi:hypothetical protein